MSGAASPSGGGVAFKDGAIRNGAGGRYVGTSELSDMEACFVGFYVANRGNAVDAAREAGYSSPHSEGYRLLRRPHVRRAIQAHAAKKAWPLRIAATAAVERVLNDVGQPGDITLRASRLAFDLAAELDAVEAKAAEREDGSHIPDGSGRGGDEAISPELSAILAHMTNASATTASQPVDKIDE